MLTLHEPLNTAVLLNIGRFWSTDAASPGFRFCRFWPTNRGSWVFCCQERIDPRRHRALGSRVGRVWAGADPVRPFRCPSAAVPLPCLFPCHCLATALPLPFRCIATAMPLPLPYHPCHYQSLIVRCLAVAFPLTLHRLSSGPSPRWRTSRSGSARSDSRHPLSTRCPQPGWSNCLR